MDIKKYDKTIHKPIMMTGMTEGNFLSFHPDTTHHNVFTHRRANDRCNIMQFVLLYQSVYVFCIIPLQGKRF